MMDRYSILATEADTGRLERLLREIRACRVCRDAPHGAPLAHEPRPVLRASATARLLIAGQAPGIRVHNSGSPFTDPSGDRLRGWMGVDEATFYDETRIAIVPMGFCFPGWDARKGDLPPRPECAARWHDRLMPLLTELDTILVVGAHARAYHFARMGLFTPKGETLTQIISRWREFINLRPKVIALPHPSWRNSGWLKKHPWFESDLLPELRSIVSATLAHPLGVGAPQK